MGRSCGSCSCSGGATTPYFTYKRLPEGFTDCIGHPALPIDYPGFETEVVALMSDSLPVPAWDSGHWLLNGQVFSPGWSFKYRVPPIPSGAAYFAIDDQARVYTFSRQRLYPDGPELGEFDKKILRIRRYSPDSDSWQTVLERRTYPRWVFEGRVGDHDIRNGKIAIVGAGAREHHSITYRGMIELYDLEDSGELLWSRNLDYSATDPFGDPTDDGLNDGWGPFGDHIIRAVRIGADGDVYITVIIDTGVADVTTVQPGLLRLDGATGALKGWYGRWHGQDPGGDFPFVVKTSHPWAFDINDAGDVLIGIAGNFGDGAGGAFVRLGWDEEFQTDAGNSDPTSYGSVGFREVEVIAKDETGEYAWWGHSNGGGTWNTTGAAAFGGSASEVVFPYIPYPYAGGDPSHANKLCKASGGVITESYIWGVSPYDPDLIGVAGNIFRDATGWYHTGGSGGSLLGTGLVDPE